MLLVVMGGGASLPDSASAGRQPLAGNLAQLSGAYGCFADGGTEGCATGRGLKGAAAVVVSPDGRHVYAASNNSSAVTAFERNRRSGVLAQIGCVSFQASRGCMPGRGLRGSFGLAMSPDARHLYVATFRGVTVLVRNTASGSLSQPAGTAGCVSQDGNRGCARGRALASVSSVAVSRDGKNVYAASMRSNAVAAFARDQSTGGITQLEGAAGCVSQLGTEGCLLGRALGGAFSVAISPDGRHVYVSGSSANSIVLLTRDPTDGVLEQPDGTDGCIDPDGGQGCAGGRGLSTPNGVTVSGDGRNVYVASSGSRAVVAFAREPATGALIQIGQAFGCTSQAGTEGCAAGRALDGAFAVAMGPDDDNAYAVSSNAVISFYRNPITGGLTQFPRAEVCTSQQGRDQCLAGRGLSEASSVALSPDGRSAYVASYRSNAVAVFARNPRRARIAVWTRGARRRCVRRDFRVRVKVRSTLPVRSISVRVDRRRIGSRKGVRALVVRVRARRMKPGVHRLHIAVNDVADNRARRSLRFKRCRASSRRSRLASSGFRW